MHHRDDSLGPMAKKRKKRARPTGEDPQELRQKRLEARRQAKAEALAAQRKRQRRETLVRLVTMLVLAGLVFWFIFLRDRAPSEINGNAIETMSVRGVGDHTRDTVAYETTPPVSGAHAPTSPPCGKHGAPIEDELQVHMLEHGAVGIQYRPDVAIEDIRKIEEIVDDFGSYVFSAPYLEMETPIAVTSWARIMRLDALDEDAIRQYAERFRDRGPEPDQTCPNDVDQPYQPPEEQSGIEVSPEPGDGPEPEETP